MTVYWDSHNDLITKRIDIIRNTFSVGEINTVQIQGFESKEAPLVMV